MKRQPLESDIQRTITDYLTHRHIFWWRQNSGVFKNPSGHVYRFGPVGASDLVAIKDGLHYAIECKRKGKKQSPAQKDFQKELEQAGGMYILAYELDDVIKRL